jgi:protein TonB
MKSNSVDRLTSLFLTTAMHAAAGLALLLQPPPGGAKHGNSAQDRRGVLIVELTPLEQGTTARTALVSDRQDPHAQPVPEPVKPIARRSSTRASAAKSEGGKDKPASLGTAPQAAQVGSAASALTGTSAMTYRDLLLAHIARFRQYPAEAHRDRLEGSVEVGFTLNRDGSVDRAWIVSSSGRQVFDREALAAVRRAVPMPAIPSDLPSSLDVSLPVDFEIE